MHDSPLVSVIIPNYNRCDDLHNCLDSIINSDYSNIEIIVVDNNSTDNSKHMIDVYVHDYKNVKALYLEENLMAAGGRNAGIGISSGDYLLFVDSDNIIDTKMISNLVVAMENNQEIGLIGPVMYYYRDKSKCWFAGNTINTFTSKTRYYTDEKYLEKLRIEQNGNTDHIPNCMMVRKSVQEKIGLFDETYYIMYEEADFAKRISKLGYQVKVNADAITYHNIQLPSEINNPMRKLGCDNPVRTYHFSKNRNIYISKYASLFGKITYFCFFRFIYAGLYISYALIHKRPDIAKAWLRGVFYHV
ncbi:MAG: glycosyltransferase family 2 protein [Treponema sp.]|nr:glycosyltransferase family 2 protein [Treponema sp.]